MNWHDAFHLSIPTGINYQGGNLDISARITIQMMHRLGAFITASFLCFLASYLLFTRSEIKIRAPAICILIFCLLQVMLGIINVTHWLPLSVAVMHNGVAAMLLLSVVTLNYWLFNNEEKNEKRFT